MLATPLQMLIVEYARKQVESFQRINGISYLTFNF